ncbi:MAG: hypothetical protein ACYTEZ_09690 [Planctomycetota bacterium]
MRAVAVLLLLPVLAWAEDAGKKQKKRTPGEIAIEDPGTTIEDPAVAKREVARFLDKMKAAADDAERVRLLTRLGAWDHPEVFKTASRYLRHKSGPVAVAAVVACARQAESRERAGALLYRSLGREKREAVACALWVGAGRLGYDRKPAFTAALKILSKERGEIRKAATRYLGYTRAKQAFRPLAEQLDEPTYARPSGDARKMPESYWRELHDSWAGNRPHVQWALSRLVPGETFETRDEARQWAETEGKKHGIRWK